jgi:undecaprenyl-diphosphatase
MVLEDSIAHFILYFSHFDVLVFPLIGAFFLSKQARFGHLIYLLLFTIIFNNSLKNYFHVPLFPHLNKVGFAFPSGHMQGAATLYGWLALNSSRLHIKGITLFLLGGIGFSLVHCAYHTWWDVGGGLVAAALTLGSYRWAQHKISFLKNDSPGMGLVLLILCALQIPYIAYTTGVAQPLWMAFYALAGFTFSWCWFFPTSQGEWPQKVLSLVLCCAGWGLIYGAFTFCLPQTLPLYLSQSLWLFLGALIPFSVRVRVIKGLKGRALLSLIKKLDKFAF